MAARKIGALRTVVIGEVAGLTGYLTLLAAGHFSLRGVGGSAWLLVLAGVVAVIGYLAMYRGLESGHVGLVSAISACYGGVIALPSVSLLHERLTAAVSSAYPVIPLIGGLPFFRERLMRQQFGGALLILAGLVLLGFGS